jgi:plastocyanin
MPTPSPAATITITINGMSGSAFSPSPVNVRVGQPVRWFNADSIVHTATQDGGGLDTGPIAPGSTSTPRTLGIPGSVGYHCSFHPSMVGTLDVAR